MIQCVASKISSETLMKHIGPVMGFHHILQEGHLCIVKGGSIHHLRLKPWYM